MSRNVWREFLNMYVSMPCLWKVKSDDYRDRDKRNQCFQELVEVCRKIEPTANKEFVQKKINSYRTTFRKEHKKFTDSKKFGTGTDDLYKPSLWYYDILLPTVDQGVPRSSRSTLEDLEGEHYNINHDYVGYEAECDVDDVADSDDRSSTAAVRVNTTAASSPGSASLYLPPTPDAQADKRKRRATKSDNELLMLACQQLSSSSKQDEFDTFGTNIAAKLRKLAKVNNMQRIIAEKLMSDVIFYGQLQTLTCNTSIHIPVQNTNESSTTFTNSPTND